VNAVGGGTTLKRQVDRKLAELQKLSPVALKVAKKAMCAWDSTHFAKDLARAEKIYLEELSVSEDAAEGITAWMEKRAPKWKGN